MVRPRLALLVAVGAMMLLMLWLLLQLLARERWSDCFESREPFAPQLSVAAMRAVPQCPRDRVFAVYAQRWTDAVGASLVLFELARLLHSVGCRVALTGPAASRADTASKLPAGVELRSVAQLSRRAASGECVVTVLSEDTHPSILDNAALEANAVVYLLYYPGLHGSSAAELLALPNAVWVWKWEYLRGAMLPAHTRGLLHLPLELPRAAQLFVTQLNEHLIVDHLEVLPPDRVGSVVLVKKGRRLWSDAAALSRAVASVDMGQVEERAGVAPLVLESAPGPEAFCALCRTKRIFYSFDVSSYYSVLAVMCGCVSVVLPPPGTTMAVDGFEIYGIRHGIAMGRARVEWAQATRALLLEEVRCTAAYQRANVAYFASNAGCQRAV